MSLPGWVALLFTTLLPAAPTLSGAEPIAIDYLGQTPPGCFPERFAPELFQPNEWGPVFSPDGNELFSTWQNPDGSQDYHLQYRRRVDGVWSPAGPAPFADPNGAPEIEPNFSPDGQRLYFDSERAGGFGGADIWYVEKTATGWSAPINAGSAINTKANDNFPFFAADGTFYFCSDRDNTQWDIDIFTAPLRDGSDLSPQRLGPTVNSPRWDSCPTAVGTGLLFNALRDERAKTGSLYFSARSDSGWSEAEMLPPCYNGPAGTWGIVLSPDRRVLFFYQKGVGVFWVDASVVGYFGVKQAPFDYVTGWYAANRAQMAQALHPQLAKRQVVSDMEVRAVSYDWMIDATERGFGRIADPKAGRKDISILAAGANTASIRLVSDQFLDYLHLVKIDGQWKIVNALWDYAGAGEPGARPELQRTLQDYAQCWRSGDRAGMAGLLHREIADRRVLSSTQVANCGYDAVLANVGHCVRYPDSQAVKIEILDCQDTLASAAISDGQSTEFLQLHYAGGVWRIVNVLRNYALNDET